MFVCHHELLGAHVAGNLAPGVVTGKIVRILIAQMSACRADERKDRLLRLTPSRRIGNAAA
jgi:hypothetical protein